jgi:hypothetical protein
MIHVEQREIHVEQREPEPSALSGTLRTSAPTMPSRHAGDCDTTGIGLGLALVKFTRLVGASMKIVNIAKRRRWPGAW